MIWDAHLSKTIHIVVTCTKRKTQRVASACMLRSLDHGTIEERASEWIRRLRSDPSSPFPARELYSGDHWQVALSLVDAAAEAGFTATLWVCSAGYGLVSCATRLKPYSATFSPSHPDSVVRNVKSVAEHTEDTTASRWWKLLSRWKGANRGGPRSLGELADENERSALWIIASAVYLRAIAPDIAGAKDRLKTPERLLIFSAGSDALPGLTDHLLPCDARFQSLVGGARRSLNVRLARHALLGLSKGAGGLESVRDRYKRLLPRQPELPQFDRISASDDEINAFIRAALRRDPEKRFTRLLRELRDDGTACEQRRFARLFRAVSGELHET